MSKLVIVRHGVSIWSDKFTGWVDIDVAPEGISNTKKFARRIKEAGIEFDIAYTSYLKRGIKTLWTVLEEIDQMWIEKKHSWKLNERHYGALQGLNKAETAAKYGQEQVSLWRRSYDVSPPKLDYNHPQHPRHDKRYKTMDPLHLPNGESLKETYERTVPFWKEEIEPLLKQGKNIIVSAHHNSLRSIIKYLDNISNEDVIHLNVPYCIPLVYEFDENAKPLKHYYLATDKEVQTVIDSIKNQTKVKKNLKK